MVAVPGTGGKYLLLNAHMDTVGVRGMADPLPPCIDNGRGTMHMTDSLAGRVLVVANAKDMQLIGNVIRTAVADEEHGSIETRETVRYLLRTTRIDTAISSPNPPTRNSK